MIIILQFLPHILPPDALQLTFYIYTPVTGSTLVHNPESIPRPATGNYPSEIGSGTNTQDTNMALHLTALEMTEAFSTKCHHTQETLMLGQHFQKQPYNKGRLALEFDKGDLVLLNPHSLSLLRN